MHFGLFPLRIGPSRTDSRPLWLIRDRYGLFKAEHQTLLLQQNKCPIKLETECERLKQKRTTNSLISNKMVGLSTNYKWILFLGDTIDYRIPKIYVVRVHTSCVPEVIRADLMAALVQVG